MRSDIKKIFFSSLLTVLFIISNLIGLKYTSFLGMVISVNFITYPFILLCILLILDMFGKEDTFYIIITTVFIQVFLLLSYSLCVNMSGQSVLPDLATSVNQVFAVYEVPIMASLIAFMVSDYVIIYLVSIFSKIRKKFFGILFGTLFALIVYGLIYILICHFNVGIQILLNLIVSHIIMSVMMSVVVIILFYILKQRECIYTEDDFDKIVLTFDDSTKFNDKTVLEVITLKERKNIKDDFCGNKEKGKKYKKSVSGKKNNR